MGAASLPLTRGPTMSGIYGGWRLDGDASPLYSQEGVPPEGAASTEPPIAPERSSPQVWREGAVTLGAAPTPGVPGSGRGVVCDGLHVIAADARIDNREEVGRALGYGAVGRPEASSHAGAGGQPAGDARLVLDAYRRWGRACVDRLVGAFAFAVWDVLERELFLARDPIGVRALYYAFQPHRFFVFASALDGVLAMPEVPRTVDDVRVADYLARRAEDPSRTFYAAVRRVPPGHTLALRPGGPLAFRRYWSFEVRAHAGTASATSDAEWEEGFRAVFEEAVRCRVPEGEAGVLLSGGLDSSSVACVAARLRGGLHTFTGTFPHLRGEERARSDERSYVAAVAASTGATSHLVPLTGCSPTDELDRYVDALGQPPFVCNLYLIHRLQRAARAAGVRVLLDGCEGDDAVSHGFERFWELAYQGRWDVFRAEAQSLADRSGGNVAAAFAQFGRQGTTARARAHPFRFLGEVPAVAALGGVGWGEALVRYGVRPWLRTLMPRRGSDQAVPELLAADLVRRTRYREVLAGYAGLGRSTVPTAQEVHRLRLAAGAGATATVLEESAALARMDGVERRHPFYDVRLLNYCIDLPADQKLRDGLTRSILRRALSDDLPQAVSRRVDKADLSIHFHRTLFPAARSRAERVLGEGWAVLAPYVEREAARAAYERGDGETVWRILSLHRWLRYTIDAPKARGRSAEDAPRELHPNSACHK